MEAIMASEFGYARSAKRPPRPSGVVTFAVVSSLTTATLVSAIALANGVMALVTNL
jgi:hypothetical protein